MKKKQKQQSLKKKKFNKLKKKKKKPHPQTQTLCGPEAGAGGVPPAKIKIINHRPFNEISNDSHYAKEDSILSILVSLTRKHNFKFLFLPYPQPLPSNDKILNFSTLNNHKILQVDKVFNGCQTIIRKYLFCVRSIKKPSDHYQIF